jgi:DNA polymerase III epsilon subunit-like protein
MKWSDSFLAIDVEATGLSEDARLLGLGVVVFRNGIELTAWSQFFNPGEALRTTPSAIFAANGLLGAQVERMPAFRSKLTFVKDVLLQSKIWTAYNLRFDQKFLRREFKFLGHDFDDFVRKNGILLIDTRAVFAFLNRDLPKRDLNRKYAFEKYGLRVQAPSRSPQLVIEDARSSAQLLLMMEPELPSFEELPRFIDAANDYYLTISSSKKMRELV